MADYKVGKPIESMEGAFDVSEKNVLITGGTRGIGRGIAQAFAESGANVIAFGRNEERGKRTVEELSEYPGKMAFYQCNVADLDSVKAAAAKVFADYGYIDVLINNAGVTTTTPLLDDTDLAEWHRVIDVDLHGVANMIYVFTPNMIENGIEGTIINISSSGGERVGPSAEMPPYHVAKAAVNMLSRYCGQKFGKYNIRCLALGPGPIHSDLDENLPEEAKRVFQDVMPAHRFGEAIEIGAFCVFLASPAASFIRGASTSILMDGGLTLVE